MDPNTGNPYPPTAQHAIREGLTVALTDLYFLVEMSNSTIPASILPLV
jgi:hypothetical protein